MSKIVIELPSDCLGAVFTLNAYSSLPFKGFSFGVSDFIEDLKPDSELVYRVPNDHV